MDDDNLDVIQSVVDANRYTIQPHVVSTNENLPANLTQKHIDYTFFSKVVEAIVGAYQHGWVKEKLEYTKSFLTRTWSGIALPVLSVCGQGTQEIQYSTYLGYFLDRSKPHGLREVLLVALLFHLVPDKIDLYDATVVTEMFLGTSEDAKGTVGCYCDIVISTPTHLIFIEQKISSAESENLKSETSQLVRYDNAIKSNPEFQGREWIRIYLSPTGKQASESTNWKSLSYPELVDVGLNVLRSCNLSSPAKENLKRFLLDLALGPFRKSEIEILDLIRLAEKAVFSDSFNNRLKFDQAVSRNSKVMEILMEG